MRYWLLIGKLPSGPYLPEQLLDQEDFGPDSMICPEVSSSPSDWQKAEEIEEVRVLFHPSPDALPPSPDVHDDAGPASSIDGQALPEDPSTTRIPSPASGGPSPESSSSSAEISRACDVLIFDDSLTHRTMYEDILESLGYTVDAEIDGKRILENIREKRPRLVILDVMMPGMDGYNACKLIKGTGDTKDVKVVIATARQGKDEKSRAVRVGADYFLQKPFHISTVKDFASRLLEGGGDASTGGGESDGIRFMIWGAGAGTDGYCASVEIGDHLFVFDAGPALARLQKELLQTKRYRTIILLLSQCKMKTTAGLRRLEIPEDDPSFKLVVYMPQDPDVDREKLKAFFPQKVHEHLEIKDVFEDTYTITNDTHLRTIYTNAPEICIGYRLEALNKTIAYLSENELQEMEADPDYLGKVRALVKGVDLMIHNSRALTHAQAPKGSGFSTPLECARLGRETGAGKVVLFGLPDPLSEEKKGAYLQSAKGAGVVDLQIGEPGFKITL